MLNLRFIVAVGLVGLASAGPAASEQYRVHATGALLVVVEGTRTGLDAGALGLADPSRTTGLAAPRVLFDVDATAEGCTATDAGLAESQRIRRVYAVRPSAAGGLAAPADATPSAAWDAAYENLTSAGAPGGLADSLAKAGAEILAIEPDMVWVDSEMEQAFAGVPGAAPPAADVGNTHAISAGPDFHWPIVDGIGWHLVASQLDVARGLVEQRLPSQHRRVTIAHFDTGYPRCEDPGLPPRLRRDASWDFSRLSCPEQCDPTPGAEEPDEPAGIANRGHGTGTLSILAGGHVHATPSAGAPFDGLIGGAPFADVVEYRIADMVAVWQPSRIARALEWATRNGVDVVSMSMGGPPNFTLHQAINQAYCRGVAMFTATGNNIRHALVGLSSPRTMVFPARYDRVVGVAGITGEQRTYARAPWRWNYVVNLCQWVMRGNVGPRSAMDEVLAAYTPNVAWLDPPGAACTSHSLRLNGAGTSAATPQVAAAAAAFLQYHSGELGDRWRSWRKTEAVYAALLAKADRARAVPGWDAEWFGAGVVQAKAAIEYGVPDVTLRKPAVLGWSWLADLLLSMGPGPLAVEERRGDALRNMLTTEIAQLVIVSPTLATALDGLEADAPDETVRRAALAMLRDEPRASATLRKLAARAGDPESGSR